MCSVCALLLYAGFIAADWAWLHKPMLGHWDVGLGHDDRWACPRFGVTFEPYQVAVGAWQEVKTEAMPVNEALYTGVIERTVRPDGSGRWFEADVVAMTWCYHTHTRNEVSSCVGDVVYRTALKDLCAFWKLYVLIGIDCGLLVDIRWPVNT